jgi:hypothetical protein
MVKNDFVSVVLFMTFRQKSKKWTYNQMNQLVIMLKEQEPNSFKSYQKLWSNKSRFDEDQSF